MKRSLITSALCAFAGIASAQSSVTVYGTVDLAIRHVNNNSGGIWSEVSGSNNASRLGFRGTEDLGGGLLARFVLESDVLADDGRAGGNTVTPVPAGQFWSRQSWVSLTSSSLGEIRLGRDYTPAFFTVATYDPFGYIGVGAVVNLFSTTQVSTLNAAFGPNTTSASPLVRANNTVAYNTPALGGFIASVQRALGEGAPTAGATGYSKFWSGRVGYVKGPINVSAAYAQTSNTNLAGESFKEYALGGSYDFGVVTPMVGFTQLKYAGAKTSIWLLGARAPVGPGLIRASYARVNQTGTAPAALGATPVGASIDDRDASQLAAGYEYILSKRTSVYGQASRISNKGSNAAFSIGGGPAFVAGSDRKSTAYEFGVRHNF